MKIVTKKCFEICNNVYEWLIFKDKQGITREKKLTFILILIGFLTCLSADEYLKMKMFSVIYVCFVFFSIINSFYMENIMVKFVSRKKYSTIKELMKQMSQISYIFGLFWMSFIIALLCFGMYTGIMLFFLWKISISNIPIIFLSVMFAFTMFYFLYHIYLEQTTKFTEVKLRINLYTTIGTTISVIMLALGQIRICSIFVSGTILEYTWLQYFIDKECFESEKVKN